jgi:hypothetical protein
MLGKTVMTISQEELQLALQEWLNKRWRAEDCPLVVAVSMDHQQSPPGCIFTLQGHAGFLKDRGFKVGDTNDPA